MTILSSIRIWGRTDRGPFEGSLDFADGLIVISARNSFGKSTAAQVFAWCLGLEPMFGVTANDPSFLPLALREEIDLGSMGIAKVLSSAAAVTLSDSGGRTLRLIRAILGEDVESVGVEERNADGTDRRSRLLARKGTMKDATAGLQHFLFNWFGWPRAEVATYDGDFAEVYLENLAPLFYIEQEEGWSNLQARQITRYRQQQIQQVAVEYLLGSVAALEARAARQRAIFKESSLRESARAIEERFISLCRRNGWTVRWSANGTLRDIVSRWSSRTLKDALLDDAGLDVARERALLIKRAEKLRGALTAEPIDSTNASAHPAASQRVIELKRRRHEVAVEIGTIRLQREEAQELLDGLDHRIAAAVDVLRLKRSGIGRLESVECPTCHRYIDPSSFELTDESEESISALVGALKRDRRLINSNVDALDARVAGLEAESNRLQVDFMAAQRDLMHVTAAAGTAREQLAKLVGELGTVERKIDRLSDISSELADLQRLVDSWIQEALQVGRGIKPPADLRNRIIVFEQALRKYLVALGHSAVTQVNLSEVHLDQEYVPMLGSRRLQTLGSASDGPRMIAAFTLALAEASIQVGGPHPGFVILDEPLQQNPDSAHRSLFVDFLSSTRPSEAPFQTIILTFLSPDELRQLSAAGSPIFVPKDQYLLRQPPEMVADIDVPASDEA
jgi:hypothetical protein